MRKRGLKRSDEGFLRGWYASERERGSVVSDAVVIVDHACPGSSHVVASSYQLLSAVILSRGTGSCIAGDAASVNNPLAMHAFNEIDAGGSGHFVASAFSRLT